MMGMQVAPAQLFYDFSLDDHVPADHLLRRIDCFLDLESVRTALKPFYSSIGWPSVDPELMMRMLIVGYCMGLGSERRLCEEVHLNLAYRWFCRLGLDGKVPDHSTFSRNRHGRFRQSDILRHLFETIVERCLTEGLVGGEGFAVDASLIAADANKQRFAPCPPVLGLGHEDAPPTIPNPASKPEHRGGHRRPTALKNSEKIVSAPSGRLNQHYLPVADLIRTWQRAAQDHSSFSRSRNISTGVLHLRTTAAGCP
jgi:transposase